MNELKKRFFSRCPLFWRRVKWIAGFITAFCAYVLASYSNLMPWPDWLVEYCGYVACLSGGVTFAAQFTVENPVP